MYIACFYFHMSKHFQCEPKSSTNNKKEVSTTVLCASLKRFLLMWQCCQRKHTDCKQNRFDFPTNPISCTKCSRPLPLWMSSVFTSITFSRLASSAEQQPSPSLRTYRDNCSSPMVLHCVWCRKSGVLAHIRLHWHPLIKYVSISICIGILKCKTRRRTNHIHLLTF